MNKAIDSIFYIDTFEQHCVVIKGMLKSTRLEYHMKNIGIDQSLWNRYSFEHKCLNNMRKIYQHAGKCDDQQNLKDILDAAMVSTPEEFTYDIPNVPMVSTPVKKTSVKESLCLFTNILNVKREIEKCHVGSVK